ncbi:MAG TPA: ATP-binding cassette domain-containing protein [Thermodesulfobacteriota bacterium]|nr:ATP-binding cassette domain-containing protein [Thermodesulfobacteriota bacterium]
MEYLIHTLNLALVYTVLTVSLNLILGYGGMASMAHAAFFCIGGYFSAIVSMHFGINFLAGTIGAVLITGAVGGILAAPFIRVREEYLILFTIAFQMLVFHLSLSLHSVTGGDSGIFGVPGIKFFGFAPGGPIQVLPFMIFFVAVIYWVALNIARSPFGRILKGIREDERAVTSLGKDVKKFKIIIFMAGTGIAAGAGGVFTHYSRFINPSIGTLDESILMTAMVVLGGMANLWGSAVGAFLLIIIPEALNFLPGASDLIVPLRGIIYGVLLILFMRFRPEGLVPEYLRLKKTGPEPQAEKEIQSLNRNGMSNPPPVSTPPLTGSGHILEVKGLSKNFGGLQAVDDFSMHLEQGKITALVGPNGCGKTTAFNLVTGFLKPEKGEIHFAGSDICRLPPHKMPHIGLVRSWQDVRNFQGMTVLDNVLIARQKQSGERLFNVFFRPWRVKQDEKENLRRALEYLSQVGLLEKRREITRNLSYAEQKLLAVARLLASEAQVLLLDEPSSGVDPNWVKRFMGIIRDLAKSGKTICIVEHNLEVVRGVSDTVYFMAEGRRVAHGSAEELMANPELGKIYFGV